jgi:hypothetical protein
MQQEETLLTLAEVSIAFAGFASIAVHFRRRATGLWTPEDAFRFQVMIISSLSALFFSLFPLALGAYSISESAVWAWSSGLLLLAFTAAVGRGLPKVAKLVREARASLALAVISQVLIVGAVVLQVLNVLSLGFSREPAPYLTGVVLLVLFCCIEFVRLVAIRPGETDDRSEP